MYSLPLGVRTQSTPIRFIRVSRQKFNFVRDIITEMQRQTCFGQERLLHFREDVTVIQEGLQKRSGVIEGLQVESLHRRLWITSSFG